MSKKLLVIFLLLAYATSSLGVSIQNFYCCGKWKSVSIGINKISFDNCKEQNGTDGCCKTTLQYLKIKDSHLGAEGAKIPFFFFIGIPTTSFYCRDQIDLDPSKLLVEPIYSPPHIRHVTIYVKNRVFRI